MTDSSNEKGEKENLIATTEYIGEVVQLVADSKKESVE